MLVTGVVYTFAALLSMLGAVASVAFGVWLCTQCVTLAVLGDIEGASFLFVQAQIALIAAGALTMLSNKVARHSLILLDAIPDDEEDEEEYYDDEG